MPKIVKIEGVGNVAFPDTMDDAAISHAIETDILSQPGVAKNVPGTVANTAMQRRDQRQAQSTVPPPEGPGPVRRFLRGAGVPTSVPELRDTLLSLAGPGGEAIGAATGHPVANPVVSLLSTIGSGMGDQAGQAIDAAQHRDIGGYVRHSLGAAVPLIGPQMAEGNIAGGLGTATALLAPSIAGEAADTLAARRSTVPIRTTVEAPAPGPIRQTIGRFAEKTLPGAVSDVLKPLWRGGGTRTKTTRVPLSSITDAAGGVAPVQPIRPRSVPEFDPTNPIVFRGSTADTSLSPPPVNMDFAYGDAPEQPLTYGSRIQPRTIGPGFDPRSSGGRFAPTKSIPLVGDRSSPSLSRPSRPSSVPTSPAPTAASNVPISGFGPSVSPERVFRTTADGSTSEVPQSHWLEEQRMRIAKDAEGAGRMTPMTSSTVPSSSPSPTSTPAPSPSPSSTDGLVGQSVRFSRGNSRAHGTVVSVRGDTARIRNASGMSVRVPVSQLTILQKASSLP